MLCEWTWMGMFGLIRRRMKQKLNINSKNLRNQETHPVMIITDCSYPIYVDAVTQFVMRVCEKKSVSSFGWSVGNK